MQIYAIGIASINKKGNVLDTFFPNIGNCVKELTSLNKLYKKQGNFELLVTGKNLSELHSVLPSQSLVLQNFEKLPKDKRMFLVCLTQDKEITTTAEGYLKLHLLSKRIYRPNGLDFTGLFSVLPNVVWTNQGAIDIDEIEQRQFYSRFTVEPLLVKNLDKIPAMCDYVIPSKVRIGDASRVRLGAYLGEGTTIMHEGFVNFNAGCEGPNMIEGRISAGVFVQKGSDLGGGCSIMGTLSGGGKTVISIGQDCLIGANAGLGISLGDKCTVEAGLYLTAGTKIKILDSKKEEIMQTKAINLSKKSELLFRRNSINGAVECLTNKNTIQLNKILHQN